LKALTFGNSVTTGVGEMSLIKIGELVKQSGFSRHTIYTYLTMGLIKPTQTTSTGQNLFSRDVIKRLKLIHNLNQSGYTLRDLREIFFKNRA